MPSFAIYSYKTSIALPYFYFYQLLYSVWISFDWSIFKNSNFLNWNTILLKFLRLLFVFSEKQSSLKLRELKRTLVFLVCLL